MNSLLTGQAQALSNQRAGFSAGSIAYQLCDFNKPHNQSRRHRQLEHGRSHPPRSRGVLSNKAQESLCSQPRAPQVPPPSAGHRNVTEAKAHGTLGEARNIQKGAERPLLILDQLRQNKARGTW